MKITNTIKILCCALFSIAAVFSGDLEISGYVDVSATMPMEDDDTLFFSFDALEIDIEKKISEFVSLRADIDYYEYATEVEQAFVQFYNFTVGKFNAPIGYELLDAPDMYQYSHSLVFDNALPTNLSGIMYGKDFGEKFNATVYAMNGWDVNHAIEDKLLFGGRLGVNAFEGIGFGISAIQMNSDDTVLDIDAEISKFNNLIIGAEYNTGGVEDGWLVMANYSFDRFALTVRQDAYGDMSSFTISPSFAITDGAGLLFEYRIDNDEFDEKTNSGAVEFTFSF